MITLEDYLKKDAEFYPDKVAVICGGEKITYRQLMDKVGSRAASLSEEIQPDFRPFSSDKPLFPFRTSHTIDFLVNYFAIHLLGGVAVPLGRDLPNELFEKMHRKLKACIVPNGTADVLFTTGTTGQSKGVVISHDTIVANAENLIKAQGYHHELTFIVTGPLNHIGSLSKIFPIILTGGTLHLIDGMKNPNAFFEAMDGADDSSRFATFLVPASIRMLLAFSENRLAHYSDKLEFIETGAAPITQTDMERLCHVLPKSRLFNTYASTETGIVATYDFNHGECLPGCLGEPMCHSRISVTPEGLIACAGRTVMTGYLNEKDLTCSVLADGIVRTSDVGIIDSKRRLHLMGREDDVINVGGYKVQPEEVENAALSLPMIKDCVCISSEHRVLGTVLKMLLVLNAGAELDKKAIAHALREKLESYKVPMQYEQVESVNRTYNGKIDRKSYRNR